MLNWSSIPQRSVSCQPLWFSGRLHHSKSSTCSPCITVLKGSLPFDSGCICCSWSCFPLVTKNFCESCKYLRFFLRWRCGQKQSVNMKNSLDMVDPWFMAEIYRFKWPQRKTVYILWKKEIFVIVYLLPFQSDFSPPFSLFSVSMEHAVDGISGSLIQRAFNGLRPWSYIYITHKRAMQFAGGCLTIWPTPQFHILQRLAGRKGIRLTLLCPIRSHQCQRFY